MNKQLRILLSTFFVFFSSAAHSDWKPAFLDSNSEIKDLLATFQGQMSDLIAQAGGEARVTMVRAYQLSNSLLASLQKAYADSVHLTFMEIDLQDQKAFLDLSNLLKEMHDTVQDPLNHAFQVGDNFNAVAADVLSWSKTPIVVSYRPNYVPPTSISTAVKVTVQGQRLHKDGVKPPELRIGQNIIPAGTVTDTLIEFEVPRSIFESKPTETTFARSSLVITEPKSSWRDWVPLLSGASQEIVFPLMFTLVPESLGSYSVTTIEQVTVEDRDAFKQLRELHAAREGGGGDQDHDCYLPKEGYKFDLTTAKLVETVHTAHKDKNTSGSTNAGGIHYYEDIKTEDKICVQVTAFTGCTECGATTEGHLEVEMVRKETRSAAPVITPLATLTWRKPESIIIRPNTSQMLSITIFDRLPRSFSLASPQNLGFLTVNPDLRVGVTVLQPEQNW